MSQNSKARVAVVAAAAMVGGLVPILGATSAFAADPTAVNVSPSSQTVNAGTPGRLNVTLTGGTAVAGHLFYRVIGGNNLDLTPGNSGIACTSTTLCLVGGTVGTDTYQVFYDVTGPLDGNFQNGDPVSAPVTVTFAGTQVNATITPATGKAATNSSAAYTVRGTDANGVPAQGTMPVTITQTLPNAAAAPTLYFVDPTNATFPVATSGSTTTAVAGATTTVYTATKTLTLASGAASIGVASSAAGTVVITAGANSTTSTAGTATLTVSAGNPAGTQTASNDNAKNLALNTPTSTAFAPHAVTEVVTVTNLAGDALGGVEVSGAITAGPSLNQTVSPGTTDQFGHATLTYTSVTPGADTFKAWVNQDTNAVNTNNADPAEPQATGTVNLVQLPANAGLSGAVNGSLPKQLTQQTTTVTYTLTGTPASALGGLTLDFTIDPTSTPAGKAYTVTPSAITDANGKATVTVTNAAPAAGDTIKVLATLHGDTTAAAPVTITYEASAAQAPTLTPAAQTLAAGAVVSQSVKVLDQFGNPVAGKAVIWSVAGRNGPATNTTSSGTGTTDANGAYTFAYTDNGPAITSANQANLVDTVTATVGGAATNAETVRFVVGTAATSSLALSSTAGTAGTTADPVSPAKAPVTTITAVAKDAQGVLLANKSVTFSFIGTGTFADANGVAIAGNSTTVRADANGVATVYVRSATTGVQTITSTSDGVSSNPGSVKVTYTNDYVGITPVRVLDTRTGQGSLQTVNGGLAPAVIAQDTNYVFDLASTNLPLGKNAYAFNVTAIGATQLGNLRIGPADGSTPETSLINYQPGKDVANFVVVPPQWSSFVVYSAGSPVSVAIDAVGYYGDNISTDTPSRLVDTRIGQGGVTGPIAGNTSRSFQILPATTDVSRTVALNVTAIQPSGQGNLRVYPNGAAAPNSSNVNYILGVDKSAFAIVNVPANGKVDIYSAGGSADVAVDLFATYSAGTTTHTAAPVRILDTRTAGTTIAANGTLDVQVAGKAGVPNDAQAVLVSVTGVHTMGSTGFGNLRAYPAGAGVPNISTLNYVSATSDVANFAIVKLGANGKISLASFGSPIDALVDVVGYVAADAPAPVN